MSINDVTMNVKFWLIFFLAYKTFKRALWLSQKSLFIEVCLQIDPESNEWGLSARSIDLEWNPQQRMIILGELNRLSFAISSLLLCLEININQIEVSVTLFEMDPCNFVQVMPTAPTSNIIAPLLIGDRNILQRVFGRFQFTRTL